MICATVHSNNVLTINDSMSAIVVAGSIKHETVKFLYPDNWKDYQKTAIFSANGVENIRVQLKNQNSGLYVADDECYIPFEVLEGNCFYVSLSGMCDDVTLKMAATTRAKIEVL